MNQSLPAAAKEEKEAVAPPPALHSRKFNFPLERKSKNGSFSSLPPKSRRKKRGEKSPAIH